MSQNIPANPADFEAGLIPSILSGAISLVYDEALIKTLHLFLTDKALSSQKLNKMVNSHVAKRAWE